MPSPSHSPIGSPGWQMQPSLVEPLLPVLEPEVSGPVEPLVVGSPVEVEVEVEEVSATVPEPELSPVDELDPKLEAVAVLELELLELEVEVVPEPVPVVPPLQAQRISPSEPQSVRREHVMAAG